MNKRILLVLAITVMVSALVVTACAPKPAPAPAPAPAPSPAPAPAPAPKPTPAPAPAGQIKFILAHGLTAFPQSDEGYGIDLYVEALMGATQYDPRLKDKVKLEVYDSGVLYDRPESQKAVASGAIQMTYTMPSYLGDWSPEWALLDTPGVWTGQEHLLRALATQPWKESEQSLATRNNVRIIHDSWWYVGGASIFTKTPAKTLEDLKGIKIRTWGAIGLGKVLGAWGMQAVPIDWAETVTALQTGLVDSVVTSVDAALNLFHLDPYCKNAIVAPILPTSNVVIVNNQWWQSLPPDVRDAIDEVFQKTGAGLSSFGYKTESSFIEQWKSKGLNLTTISESDFKRWLDVAKPTVAEIAGSLDPKYLQAFESTR